MNKVESIFQLIETKLDDIEELVDLLEDEGEPIDGIRNAISKLWDEINEIS